MVVLLCLLITADEVPVKAVGWLTLVQLLVVLVVLVVNVLSWFVNHEERLFCLRFFFVNAWADERTLETA